MRYVVEKYERYGLTRWAAVRIGPNGGKKTLAVYREEEVAIWIVEKLNFAAKWGPES